MGKIICLNKSFSSLHIVVVCPSVTPPAFGSVMNCTNDNKHGSTCAFQCNQGYQLVGVSAVTCVGDSLSKVGTWDHDTPLCQGTFSNTLILSFRTWYMVFYMSSRGAGT